MSTKSSTFRHVSHLWDHETAARMEGDEVSLLLYRSNLLGADLRLTNYGGGNTSCKVRQPDALSGEETDVMWIKGSGGDLGTLKKTGLSALYLNRLHQLKNRYRGLAYEDEMVDLFNHCIYDLQSKAPSIDTPLHAFLPFRHIDHLHPDAAIAIAAAADGEKIVTELFSGSIGWVPWQRPGFDLALKLKECLDRNPGMRGIMLGSHGLFTWGDTAYESYINTLEVIERCAEFIEHAQQNRKIFGGQKLTSYDAEERQALAAKLAPALRGFCSSEQPMVGHFNDDEKILQFLNSEDFERLVPLGTSCPDHFLRTKICPLVVDFGDQHSWDSLEDLHAFLTPLFNEYRKGYIEYYNQCKRRNSPAVRDPNPVIILVPRVGMFSFAKDKQTARVASEFYLNAINVMRGAEAISTYTSLPRQEAFDIEYWLLEEAKLQRMPKPKPLAGKIALVTGSGGGIGKAIARRFLLEGACVVLNDKNPEYLEAVSIAFTNEFGKDAVTTALLDVTSDISVERAMEKAALSFGGIDILVNNAGLSISKTLENYTDDDSDLLLEVLVKGQMRMTQAVVRMMRKQKMGGDIINIVSKNALVSGPSNAMYGASKAAQLHLSRLTATETGKDKIRVNVVNPDAVISGSNIWSNGWAEGRAKAYGISVEQLPEYYASRTILGEMILPEDIANACFAFVGGLLSKSTGNMINVDGGIGAAFPR